MAVEESDCGTFIAGLCIVGAPKYASSIRGRSLCVSPGLALPQNLVEVSWLHVASTWPMGCHAIPLTAVSCAFLISAWIEGEGTSQ